MEFDCKSLGDELRIRFLRFPQAWPQKPNHYFFFFFFPAVRTFFSAAFFSLPPLRSGEIAADFEAGASADCFSADFPGFFSFSFFLGASLIPENFLSIFTRSSGVLP